MDRRLIVEVAMLSTSPPAGTEQTDRLTDFWTLLLADPDLLQQEFEAIVSAEWPDRPPVPPRRGIPGLPHPGDPWRGWSARRRCLSGCLWVQDGRPRQRSPPRS
jgi:hypothetical protein